jgi:hypothetical protein
MTPASQYQSEKTTVDAEAESKWVIACRAVAFTLLMLYVVFGPFYKQVLNGKGDTFRAWQMYHTRGIGICDVEFYIRHPDGRIEHIDYLKTLGYDKLRGVPHRSRRIMGSKGVLSMGQRLRQKVGAAADLRVNARIGTRDGWQTLYADKRIE